MSRHQKLPSIDTLKFLYYNKLLSQQQIALMFHCTQPAVFLAFKEYGLQTRPLGWKHQGQWIKCANCGKEIYRYPASLRNWKTFFCSKHCGGVFRWHRGIAQKMNSAPNPNAVPKYYPRLNFSPELAYVVGILIGDGSVGNRSIRLSVKEETFAISFAEAMNKIGLPARIYRHTRFDKPKPLTTFTCQTRSSIFIKWYNELDLPCLAKQFPIDFLRGFYESEGSYSPRNGLYICNSDFPKLELVTDCLKLLGFASTTIKQYIYPNPRIKNKKPMYRIGLHTKESRNFLIQVKPCIKGGDANEELSHNCCVSS